MQEANYSVYSSSVITQFWKPQIKSSFDPTNNKAEAKENRTRAEAAEDTTHSESQRQSEQERMKKSRGT